MGKSPLLRLLLAALSLPLMAVTVMAQEAVDVYDPASGNTSRYGYEDGLGQGLRRGLGQGNDASAVTQETPELFWVRGGQLTYCAHCGQLLMDTVGDMQVSAAQARDYYDDGTHGDIFPNDGVPTNIVEDRNTFIGPYSYHSYMTYKDYIARAREMGAREFYQVDAGTYKIHEERTYEIPPDSSGEIVKDEGTENTPKPPTAKEARLTSIPEVNARLKDFFDEFEAIVDDIFSDFQPHADDIRNVPIGSMSPPVLRSQYGTFPGQMLLNQPGMAGPYGPTIGRARSAANTAEVWNNVNTPVVP